MLKIIIWIPILIMYFCFFRMGYMQYRMAKLLRDIGYEHNRATSIHTFKNIALARNIAKEIDDVILSEKLMKEANGFEKSKTVFFLSIIIFVPILGLLVWVYNAGI